MTKPIRNTGPCFHLSLPRQRGQRDVLSHTEFIKRPYSVCSQSSRPSPLSYEKATHGRLVGPTLSTPRGDNNYNQYRPLCEVCPRDRDKVVGTLQGNTIVDRRDHVQYLTVSKSYSDNCTCSLTEQNTTLKKICIMV